MTELDRRKFYIDGSWVDPSTPNDFVVMNPATEEPIATISMGTSADVDRAVAAANRAFVEFSRTSKSDRIDLLEEILKIYKRRIKEFADTITAEMGAPTKLSVNAQAPVGIGHLEGFLAALKKI